MVKKRVKDPNAPKRAMSAFFFFANEIRPSLREKHPEKKITELTTLISEEWAKLTPADKGPYEAMAAKDKERYQREMKSYVPPPETGIKKKDPNAPKRAKSAYIFFGMDERPKIMKEHPDLPMTEVSRVIAERWAKLSSKSKYEARASEDKKRYAREKAAYDALG